MRILGVTFLVGFVEVERGIILSNGWGYFTYSVYDFKEKGRDYGIRKG
jgi:hypothetical protein